MEVLALLLRSLPNHLILSDVAHSKSMKLNFFFKKVKSDVVKNKFRNHSWAAHRRKPIPSVVDGARVLKQLQTLISLSSNSSLTYTSILILNMVLYFWLQGFLSTPQALENIKLFH